MEMFRSGEAVWQDGELTLWPASLVSQPPADYGGVTEEQAQAWLDSQTYPITFDRPIQAQIETRAADGHVYGLEVDPDGGEVVPVQRESTRLTQAEYEAAKALRMQERSAHRDRIAAIEKDLNQVEAAVSNIVYTGIVLTNMTTTAAVWTDPAQRATVIAMKDALQQVKKNGDDLNTALRNLRQACEKIRREIR
jgi:hypothetical protein